METLYLWQTLIIFAQLVHRVPLVIDHRRKIHTKHQYVITLLRNYSCK